jgi:hypothetical protein
MLLMLGIPNGFEELLVPPNASHVRWWAGLLARDAPWVADARLRREDFLHVNAVVPAIAEVVLVEEGGARLWSDLA